MTNSMYEVCSKLLHYDPLTGIITWKVKRNGTHKGAVAGTLGHKGIKIGINRVIYPAHQIAWLLTYGKFGHPLVDHINGKPKDNRLCNLREATHAQNAANRKRHITNELGQKGVRRLANCKTKPFMARICKNYKTYYLGVFATKEAAQAAYNKKATELFGVFKRDS